ncbi:MAG: hypothetical protein JWQ97_840 [Phenylobacterium sp.]|nr:hypothetical protein [Phenylobacterium sp.]
MRRIAVFTLAAAAAINAAACTTAPADGSPKIQTTSQANRENLEGPAKAPLRDLNVLRTKIPDVLLQAMADPYERPPADPRLTKKAQCAQLVELLQPLDHALGADLDSPSLDEDDLLEKGRDRTLGVMATLASGAIPFRGWVRKLSGAERHDSFVQAAITAGAVRRAYLKGLGEAHGCNPPGTPSHVLTGAPVETQAMKPRYPIR